MLKRKPAKRKLVNSNNETGKWVDEVRRQTKATKRAPDDVTASKLFARDDAQRRKGNVSSMAFIAPKFPKTMPARWKRAVKFLKKAHPRAYMLHVYAVAQLLVDYADSDK